MNGHSALIINGAITGQDNERNLFINILTYSFVMLLYTKHNNKGKIQLPKPWFMFETLRHCQQESIPITIM